MDEMWVNGILIGAGVLAGLFIPHLWKIVLTIQENCQSPEKAAKNCLRRLNQQVFSCLLEPTYVDNTYLYERRIHQQKRLFMRLILRLRNKKLHQLYGAVMNYSQLRWRVTDFAVFSVCRRELLELSKATDQLFLQKQVDTSQLALAIGNFEDIIQQVLQVTSPEPIVFTMFVAGLRDFEGCFKH